MHIPVQQQLAKMFTGHQKLMDIGVKDTETNM